MENKLQDDCRFEQAGDRCDELADQHAPNRKVGIDRRIRPALLQTVRGFLAG